MQTNKFSQALTTETHITESVISIFFKKNVIRYACGCFQNIVFWFQILFINSTNPIDKVNFNIIISKKMFNFFLK
jgi:hypothetical protein